MAYDRETDVANKCEYGEEECDHLGHVGMRKCPGLTQAEIERGEKLASLGFSFVGGQDSFHGDYGTLREQQTEIMANAKKYGNPEPEYMGKRSKMRPLSELTAEGNRTKPKNGVRAKLAEVPS